MDTPSPPLEVYDDGDFILWGEDIAREQIPEEIEDDVLYLTTPIRTFAQGTPQKVAEEELDDSLGSISLSPIAPVARGRRRADIDPMTPLRPGAARRGLRFETPERSGGRTNLVEVNTEEQFGFSLLSPVQIYTGEEDSTVVVSTTSGKRRLDVVVPGRVLVDNSATVMRILRQATLTSFSITSKGQTNLMGGGAPTVTQDRDLFVCTFKQWSDKREKENPDRPIRLGRQQPFRVWSQSNVRESVPLGMFSIKPAYFVGRRKGDMIEKQEMGMMYSPERPGNPNTTLILTTNPNLTEKQRKNHFIILVKIKDTQRLFQIAIHKRVWAHSFQKGSDEVYFPRVPIHDDIEIGLRLHGIVRALKRAGLNEDGKPKRAVVSVTRVTLELPSTIAEVVAGMPKPKMPTKLKLGSE